jgi:putative hydrolase of the HAD superfamily
MKIDFLEKHITPLSPIKTSLEAKGEPVEEIKGVLFDIYGTLFISESGGINISEKNKNRYEKINKLLTRYSISSNSENLLPGNLLPENLLKDLFGKIKEKHEELKQKGVDYPEVEIDRIWAEVIKINDMDLIRKFAAEYDFIVNPVYPMPGLEKTISTLKKRNILMGIISNAQFYTQFLFELFFNLKAEELGFDSDLIFFSYRYGYAKPSSHMFRLAAKELEKRGLNVQSVLYIGNDMRNDILAAKKEGFQTALFAGDKRSLRLRQDEPECKDIKPDFVITDLIQLLDFTIQQHVF